MTLSLSLFLSLSLSKVTIKDMGYEIKDAYPKKVCHMPTRHVKKKKKKKKRDSPHPWKIKKRDGSCKGVHPHYTKDNSHTLAHLDQIV